MKVRGHAELNELILRLSEPSVRRDQDGIPTAFRILKPGAMSLTIDGQAVEGRVDAADISSILDYHRLKGEDIPIDCEHLLQVLADVKGVEERELVKNDALLAEKAAAGFATLSEESGELWAKVTKWSARAKELLSSAGDKMYGYMSPVLRGLKTGPLRITSLALTNLPAINKQELLAATEISTGKTELKTATMTTRGGMTMDWLRKLAERLKQDVAALTAEGASLEPLFQAAHERIEQLEAVPAGFLSSVKDALGLSDDDTLDTAAGKVLSIVEKGKGHAAALTELQTRVADLEGKEKERLIGKLRSEGKLTDAMLPWAQKQDQAALIDFAKTAPVVADPKRTVKPGDDQVNDDTLTMSETDIEVARRCGLDPAEVAKANNLKYAEK